MARRRKRRGFLARVRITVAALIGTLMVAVAFVAATGGSITVPSPTLEASASEQQLDELKIRMFDPAAPAYDRALFGQRWSDDVTVEFGHNGCDTRNDILRRDLTDVVVKDGTYGCVALSGVLEDPYSGAVINFQRGQGTSEAVQIDHIVALADAWYAGAYAWDEDTRRNFANDPINLLAVSGAENQSKGAKPADAWLPSNTAHHCSYAQNVVHVKHVYGLEVTIKERLALRNALQTCNK